MNQLGRDNTPRWSEVTQAVKRHKPSELLPKLASMAATLDNYSHDISRGSISPWAIAALARESILYGSEMRSKPVTEKTLPRLFNLFNTAGRTDGRSRRDLQLIMGAYMYEQIKFQVSPLYEIARTYLLFVDQQLDDSRLPQRDWHDVFGMSLQERMQAVFAIAVAMEENGGQISSTDGILPDDLAGKIGLTNEQFERTINDLTTTIQHARDAFAQKNELGELQKRFAVSPLARYPLIDLQNGSLVAPQHFYILQTMTIGNLFYRGTETWEGFSEELGKRVEAYTGLQLGYAGFDQVIPEIDYGTKSPMLSIDWFAQIEDTVLLIECKSAKISADAIAGSTRIDTVLENCIGRARKQIKTSSELILSEHPKFHEIPKDLKQIGLIVTAEPIHCANAKDFHGHLTDPGIPCLAVSLRELESLTALGATRMVQVICDIVNDSGEQEPWSVQNAINKSLKPEEIPENRLILKAYERFVLPNLPHSEQIGTGWSEHGRSAHIGG
ncbi:hypothetical protein [Paeniglutamicibacter sulfureus]|uniref:NERD domain-containing protein n=1 Tax=Paeniglutamicibacter sulfureus TaxID=43666 RepID=A0ABU2BLS3_9MICC|nr:hypothetical protein [Paeniglutamicibacter sulfureus]MDR7358919.1 hypothetical protein [Paeniglutamicibacter sulfureus]